MRSIVRLHVAPQSRDPQREWTPDQQRTTPPERRAAQHPGNVTCYLSGTGNGLGCDGGRGACFGGARFGAGGGTGFGASGCALTMVVSGTLQSVSQIS
jgi:hypothetical protein